MQDEKLISNSLVFCGPFLGEFGWELTHWMPHVRWLRNHYKERHLIVASYPGRHPLYYGIANEFFPLPEWFLKEKYELDCFEALCPENVYGDLLKYFRAIYKGKFSEIIETRTPRGFNKILREMNHVSFDKLKASGSANKYCNDLIAKHNNKPCVILFARAVERKMFLDITNNRPLPVEALGGRLPPRNWPRSNWEDLFEMLYAKYNDKVTFVIGGTKNGNCLTNIKNKYQDIIDLTNIDKAMSLDITMAFLNKAMLSISSQSGPTHLSVQCGCTSFVYGHEQQRHSIDDNPLKTPVVFLETPADKYNDPPYILYEEIDGLMGDLLKEKSIKVSDISKPKTKEFKDIKNIGMVGVFDVEGSTNIPFAKAFAKAGYNVEGFGYRTIAKQLGVEKRDAELIKLAQRNDMVVFCKGSDIDPEIYKECSKYAHTIFYMMDSIDHLKADTRFIEYAQECDMSVVTTNAMKDALISSGIEKPVYHVLQGIDPEEFYPVEVENKLYDFVFIGTKSPKRDEIINQIINSGYSVKTYGNGYEGGYVTGEAFNKACSEAKICLAINNTNSDIDSFSDRILRYMATGACVLTEYTKGLENYFEEGKEIFWFKKEEDIKAKIGEVFKNYDLKAIGLNAKKRVLENYTWDRVVQKTLSALEDKNGKV